MTVSTVYRDETVTDTNDAVLAMSLHTHTDIHTNSVTTAQGEHPGDLTSISFSPVVCEHRQCGEG